MNASEAVMLVRDKHLEEQQEVTSGAIADKYQEATVKYPAIMATAHIIWALELSKKMG